MKHLASIAFLVMAIFMVSCDDNDTEKYNEKFTLKQINKVTNLSTGTSSIYTGEYKYDIDYVNGKMNITAINVSFHPMMHPITFEMKDVKFSYSENGININSTGIIPEMNGELLNQYTISSITGRITTKETPTDNVASMEFILNNQFSITAYPSPMVYDNNCATTVMGKYTYANNETSYKIVVNVEAGTADVYVNKAQFATNMPAMNMVFKGVNITATENGFSLNADSLTPCIVGDTGVETPMPNYPITELEGEIEGDYLQIKFVCSINAQGSSVAGASYNVSGFGNLHPSAN